MNHDHTKGHSEAANSAGGRRKLIGAVIMLALIGAFFLLRELATGRQPFLECGRKYQHAAMWLTKEGSLEGRRLHLRYTAHKALPLAGLMDFGAVTPETVAMGSKLSANESMQPMTKQRPSSYSASML